MITEPIQPLGITWYPTPDAVFYSMWEQAFTAEGMPTSEIADTSVIGVNSATGEDEALSVDEAIQGMKDQGMWGYIDTEARMIHAWADPGAEPGAILHMLAHEVGHITGEPAADEVEEERRADAFGAVAAEAFRLMSTRPPAWPPGLVDRVESALKRIENGHSIRRIPADPTDPDLVLAEVKAFLLGKKPPVWVSPNPACQSNVGQHDAQPELPQACETQGRCGHCHTCRPVSMANEGADMRMVLCPTCGNKRCPKANDCANACTGSNATGQPGSAY